MWANHKAWLMRLLTEIANDRILRENLRFKGGTCAAMLGYLDRFSVNLDFDILDESQTSQLKKNLLAIFSKLNLTVKNQSDKVLEFNLKYPAPPNERNTLRLDVLGKNYQENIYENLFLPEIGRYFGCQTAETMFSHKLVAPLDRYNKHQSVAGRDIYDIHHFFFTGQKYLPKLIKERTGQDLPKFFKTLLEFIEKQVTVEILVADLGYLLTAQKMAFVKKNLLLETKMFLRDEIARISQK